MAFFALCTCCHTYFSFSQLGVLASFAANIAMIFFCITGRFPSWLEDLSP
jgi:hypothetical protein